MLVLRGIPCYVPTSNDAPILENMSAGKVLFSSMHQAKGLERKCIVLYGMDASYFRYFAIYLTDIHTNFFSKQDARRCR